MKIEKHELPIPQESRVQEILDKTSSLTFLVAGDFILDRWISGTISRVSREAPVFIVDYETESFSPGGAAHTAVQLKKLGADVYITGTLGTDQAGWKLLHILQTEGIHTDFLVLDDGLETIVKTRIFAGPPYALKQQVLRLDRGSKTIPPVSGRERWVRALEQRKFDGIILSDYGYGIADPPWIESLLEWSHHTHIPLFGDTRYNLQKFRSFTALTPNEEEFYHAVHTLWSTDEQLAQLAFDFKITHNIEVLLVTRGSKGMCIAHDGRIDLIPVFGSPAPVDVSGAGDTVLSAFALAYCSTRDALDSARFANLCAGIAVMHPGVYPVSQEDIHKALREFV